MAKTYNIGDVFYLDEEYAERANFCNENNFFIEEIERDEKGRRFRISNTPTFTPEELIDVQIWDKKALLEKYKEDVEQVELFGMERADYEEKKAACKQLILDLRELEKNKNK